MLNFLTPTALFWGLLLAVPVLIHIFRPRKVRKIPFSNIRWLRESKQKFSRRLQWHQFLLFLIRAAFIALLVLGLSYPLWDSSSEDVPSERWILLDQGVSMMYKEPDATSSWERAQEHVLKLLRNDSVGESTGLIVVGGGPYTFGPKRPDASRWVSNVEGLKPSWGGADFMSAFRMLSRQMDKDDKRPAEVVVLTSNRASEWNPVVARQLTDAVNRPLKVRLLDVGPKTPVNGWIRRAMVLENEDGKMVLRVEMQSVGLDNMDRNLRVEGIPGRAAVDTPVRLRIGETAILTFELPDPEEWTGNIVKISLLPEDSFAVDDHYSLVLNSSGSQSILVVDQDNEATNGDRSGHYLRTALQSLRRTNRSTWYVRHVSPADLTEEDIRQAGVIFLVNTTPLSRTLTDALVSQVRAGAGLAIFVGNGADPAFYNQVLFNGSNPEESIAPFMLGMQDDSGSRVGEQLLLSGIDWTHPVFAQLDDAQFGDLEQTQIFTYVQPAGDLLPGSRVLASIGGKAPAIVEKNLGAGRILFFNMTANDQWSNLPRRYSFLPLVDQMVQYLSSAMGKREFAPGEAAFWMVPEGVDATSVEVVSPQGEKMDLRIERVNAADVLRFPADAPYGVYNIQWSDVNGERTDQVVLTRQIADSMLTRQSPEVLADWFKGVDFEYIELTDEQQSGVMGARIPLWPWLVGLSCLFILLEMYYVHRVCPAGAPSLASSVVEKGRILATPSESEPKV
jgi:hypothetical protein